MGLSVLIAGNAGSSDRGLLARSDFDLLWAITPDEARAAVDRLVLTVAVTREWLFDVVVAAKAARRRRSLPVLALLGPAAFEDRARYLASGATAVLAAGNPDRLYQVLSELSGLSFARYPRVEFRHEADVLVAGERRFFVTRDLSQSGISLLQFPDEHPIGAKVRIELSSFTPPLVAEAMLVRHFREGMVPAAGFCFTDLSAGDSARVQRLVAAELDATRRPISNERSSEPSDARHLAPLPDPPTLEGLARLLRGEEPAEAPEWLRAEAPHLEPAERRAALGEPAPAWAPLALVGRVHAARARARAGARNLSQDEFLATFEICNRLAVLGDGRPPDELVSIARARAAMLRKLYAPDYAPLTTRAAATRGPS